MAIGIVFFVGGLLTAIFYAHPKLRVYANLDPWSEVKFEESKADTEEGNKGDEGTETESEDVIKRDKKAENKVAYKLTLQRYYITYLVHVIICYVAMLCGFLIIFKTSKELMKSESG